MIMDGIVIISLRNNLIPTKILFVKHERKERIFLRKIIQFCHKKFMYSVIEKTVWSGAHVGTYYRF